MKIKRQESKFRGLLDTLMQLAVVVSLAWFLVFIFGSRSDMVGQSMSPLIVQGEAVLTNKAAYTFFKPKRYDVIAFKSSDGRVCIRRIIGLPGEKVSIVDGTVHINDVALTEFASSSAGRLTSGDINLTAGEYFVLGDNRVSSEDSRVSTIGNVSEGSIIGKVWLRALPVKRIGLIK